jgi:hypothetical protein
MNCLQQFVLVTKCHVRIQNSQAIGTVCKNPKGRKCRLSFSCLSRAFCAISKYPILDMDGDTLDSNYSSNECGDTLDCNDSQNGSAEELSTTNGRRARKEDLKTKIRSLIREGHTCEQILLSVCRTRNMLKIDSIEQAAQLFQQFNTSSGIPQGFTDAYRNLIRLILAEFVRSYHVIAAWPTSNANCVAFSFLDSRYALCLADKDSERQLFLVDNFYGQKK